LEPDGVPPMLAEGTPAARRANPREDPTPLLVPQLMQEESELARKIGSPLTRAGGRRIKR
jgi:hypothetical protein